MNKSTTLYAKLIYLILKYVYEKDKLNLDELINNLVEFCKFYGVYKLDTSDKDIDLEELILDAKIISAQAFAQNLVHKLSYDEVLKKYYAKLNYYLAKNKKK